MYFLPLFVDSLMILFHSLLWVFYLLHAFSAFWERLVEASLDELELLDLDVVDQAVFGRHVVDPLSFGI